MLPVSSFNGCFMLWVLESELFAIVVVDAEPRFCCELQVPLLKDTVPLLVEHRSSQWSTCDLLQSCAVLDEGTEDHDGLAGHERGKSLSSSYLSTKL